MQAVDPPTGRRLFWSEHCRGEDALLRLGSMTYQFSLSLREQPRASMICCRQDECPTDY
jgi:hypothetical protein